MAKTAPAKTAPAAEPADRKYARMVRARARCYYGQMRDEGEVFENTLDLSTYPERETSVIEAAKEQTATAEE